MKISIWRPALKQWLTSAVEVDSFDLRNPIDYEVWDCTLPPLASMAVSDTSANLATAVQDVYLTIRYRADTKFIELPINQIEGILTTLQLRIIREYLSIAPLSNLSVLSVPDPIRVTEYGDGLADWLITLVLSVELFWTAEVEAVAVAIETPKPLTVEGGLYTERLEPLAPALFPPDSHKDPRNRDKFGKFKASVHK